jgi:hypothetical protein
VLSHPPYHNIVVYSGEVWGRARLIEGEVIELAGAGSCKENMMTNSFRKKVATGMAAAGLAVVLLASGCSTTVESQPRGAESSNSPT